MSESNSSTKSTIFESDPNVALSISNEDCDDMEIIIVKNEVLSDDEGGLNCDSSDELYEFVDTSFTMNAECSDLMKDSSVENFNTVPEHNSNLVSLLVDSTLQIYKDVKTNLETSLKLHLGGEKNGVRKCQKQSKLTKSLEVDIQKVMLSGSQEAETVETQMSLPGEHQFKCVECNETFGLKNHLVMHKFGHEQFRRYNNSFPRQEVIIVKEEMLSDEEGVLNDSTADKNYKIQDTSLSGNVQYFELETDNCIRHANNTLKHGSSVAGVLVDSALENYHHIYDDLECSLGSDSNSLKAHLVSNKDGIRKHKKHFNFTRSEKVDFKRVLQQQSFQKKTMTVPPVAVEHRFKCGECSETFELKSHLVMHEISHEQYRRYSSYRRQSKSAQLIYKCKECNISFELKSHLRRHELSHDKKRFKTCRCKSPSSASASDLCTCVARVCNLCCRTVFASVKLRNWTSCKKCFLQMDSKQKIESAAASSKTIRDKVSSRTFFTKITDVKRLCYSCGKMCANVVKCGTSWMCYDCWNARLKQKGISTLLGVNQKKYQDVDCTYCSRLCPLSSHQSNHQCFHKSVYLKGYDNFDDNKIGQHFLSSVEKSSDLQNELVLWDQSPRFDDSNKSEDEEMVIDTVQVSQDDNGSASSRLILCDKTGELIGLESEVDT